MRRMMIGAIAALALAIAPAQAGHSALQGAGTAAGPDPYFGSPCSYAVTITGRHTGNSIFTGQPSYEFLVAVSKTGGTSLCMYGSLPVHTIQCNDAFSFDPWKPATGGIVECGMWGQMVLGAVAPGLNPSVPISLPPLFSGLNGTVSIAFA